MITHIHCLPFCHDNDIQKKTLFARPMNKIAHSLNYPPTSTALTHPHTITVRLYTRSQNARTYILLQIEPVKLNKQKGNWRKWR